MVAKILLVEDDPDLRGSFVLAIEMLGHEVVAVEAATSSDLEGEYHLVVSDLEVPERLGMGAAGIIAHYAGVLDAPPVVAMSGNAGKLNSLQGASLTLGKPFGLGDFQDFVTEALALSA